MSTKHTPKAITFHRGIDYTTFYDSEENEVFTVHYQMPEELANLIAAAPDLLTRATDALAILHRFSETDHWTEEDDETYIGLREAVAKSNGGQS